jgi:outer membrane biosynthesis protein TonB
MGEPQRSDGVESDRRSSPRFPADLLGKASVRLLGGSEVTLINFSERGILFQSETRLLVGARGTIRIVVGSETTIAAGTVVRSLVQGMASGKLAFHTALALDQPLALAAEVEARERAKAEASAPTPQPEPVEFEPVEAATLEAEPLEPAPPAPPVPVAEAPVPSGKTIEKRSHKGSSSKREPHAEPQAAQAPPAPLDAEGPGAAAPAPATPEPVVPAAPVAAASTPAPHTPAVVTASALPAAGGFGDTGFDGGSFGWSDPAAETSAAGLSVLFVSTSKERTSRLQGVLAGHRRDIVLTTVTHAKAETIADIARQHDVLLFDFAIGPDALARTLAALRSSPLGASIAILVPQQTALPPSVSSLANACVVETTSGNMLVAALRDAAWTPWQPVDAHSDAESPRDGLFWKAFDALPVPVLVVDAEGGILHANAASAKLVDGVEIVGRPLASFFVAEDAPAIAKLIADGLAGGYQDTPVFTAPADGTTVQIVLQALSVLPGAGARPELALRCEVRAEETVAEPPAADGLDLAAEIEALTAARDELARIADASRSELTRLREEVEESRGHINGARRERDELRGQLEIAQRDLERARDLERTGAAKIVELERLVADTARSEVAAARAQSQLAAATEELSTVRTELDGLRLRTTTQGAEAERTAVRYAAIETSARQAIEELKTARADVLRLTRERDQALAAGEAERARADAALAAVRDDAKKSRKLGSDDTAAHSAAKFQRQIDELRAEVKQEQDARRELEELLDQNATNLEQTIQDYEERLEALGAGVEDKRPSKPKKTRQG